MSVSPNNRFTPRRYADKPRRVRRGLKLAARPDRLGLTRVGRAWLELVVASARDPQALNDGLQYAKIGQVARLEVLPGVIEADVQGRAPRPYRVRVEFDRFSLDAWEKFIATLAREARFAHGLGEGHVSDDVLDLTASMGLPLVPRARDATFRVTCTCGGTTSDGAAEPGGASRGEAVNGAAAGGDWCKHAVAVGHLVAEQLDADPALAWTFRAVDPVELVERVRLQRTIDSGVGPLTAHQPVDRARVDSSVPELERLIDSFHDLPPELHGFATHLNKPEVSHVLLRRLGPSPFEGARFPILGLLATCYDLVSETVLKEAGGNGQGRDDAAPSDA